MIYWDHCLRDVKGNSKTSIPFPLLLLWFRTHSQWLLVLVLTCTAVHAEPVADVRVLIDVSGSMKKNDPKNLRAPALRLLVGLMPEDANAGVWTFGQHVNMQVKLANVDQRWKDKALVEAGKIHSRGLFTNIEGAIKTATPDWRQPDPRYRRHLILLTDGMLDISDKDPKLNQASKQRLLENILPRLEQADASIHTIALSKNADAELLQALSGATKGAFEQVESAEQLQRIFLKLFEKSVQPDTVPIEDNRFNVDKHVSDFTLLVFLAKDSPATTLTTPAGEVWTQQKHPDEVRWHHEDGYDLISSKSPASGEWTLQAKFDPDNRVMIVTNMRLKTDKLPNMLLLGDMAEVHAKLLEDGKVLTRQALLEKTVFEIKQIEDSERVTTTKLQDDGKIPDVIKADGVYSGSLDKLIKAGDYEIIIQAKSLTFRRQARHTLKVFDSPANIAITQPAQGKPFHVLVTPHAGLIRPESVSIQAKFEEGEPYILKQTADLGWVVDIPEKYKNKKFILTLVGKRYNDNKIKTDFEQILAATKAAQSLALPIKPSDESKVKAAQPEIKEPQAEEAAPQKEEGFSWWVVMTVVLLANLILCVAGWLVYRYLRKRKARQDEVDAEEIHI